MDDLSGLDRAVDRIAEDRKKILNAGREALSGSKRAPLRQGSAAERGRKAATAGTRASASAGFRAQRRRDPGSSVRSRKPASRSVTSSSASKGRDSTTATRAPVSGSQSTGAHRERGDKQPAKSDVVVPGCAQSEEEMASALCPSPSEDLEAARTGLRLWTMVTEFREKEVHAGCSVLRLHRIASEIAGVLVDRSKQKTGGKKEVTLGEATKRLPFPFSGVTALGGYATGHDDVAKTFFDMWCETGKERLCDSRWQVGGLALARDQRSGSSWSGYLLLIEPINTSVSIETMRQIGRQAHKFSNEYRVSRGLKELEWSEEVFKICEEHSADMASGRRPFGHDGFTERIAKLPFKSWLSCENVGMNQGVKEVARSATNGWIKSPGHERNLVSATTYSAIGVRLRKSDGMFFLTQIFVKPSLTS